VNTEELFLKYVSLRIQTRQLAKMIKVLEERIGRLKSGSFRVIVDYEGKKYIIQKIASLDYKDMRIQMARVDTVDSFEDSILCDKIKAEKGREK
jgi:hypothetical protein